MICSKESFWNNIINALYYSTNDKAGAAILADFGVLGDYAELQADSEKVFSTFDKLPFDFAASADFDPETLYEAVDVDQLAKDSEAAKQAAGDSEENQPEEAQPEKEQLLISYIRALRNNADSGCLFKVDNSNIQTIIDSNPESSTYTNITGGSIQGGKSKSGGGLIEVGQKGTFNMRGGTLYDGRTDISGGAIRNLGNMNLENVRITGCKAEGSTVQDDDGGAIYSSGTATLKNCTIDNCKSYDYGGAIIVDGGNMTLEQGQITNCSTDDNEGGAIYVTGGGTLRYAGGTVKNCSAKKDEGGAIYINKVSDKHCIIRDSSIQGNTSYGNGGGLYVNYNYVTLHNCTVKENQTGQNKKGGGVYLNGGYTLGLQGKMEVLNNKVGDKTDNLYVVSGAQITNGGLYEGSEIHLTPSKSSKYKVANLSTAQIQYFKVDSGSMTMENVTTQRERFVSSAIGEESIIAISVGLMLMILIVGVVLSIKSRKTH